MPPWRNRLARSAVNRKVGGSSPPGGAHFLCQSGFFWHLPVTRRAPRTWLAPLLLSTNICPSLTCVHVYMWTHVYTRPVYTCTLPGCDWIWQSAEWCCHEQTLCSLCSQLPAAKCPAGLQSHSAADLSQFITTQRGMQLLQWEVTKWTERVISDCRVYYYVRDVHSLMWELVVWWALWEISVDYCSKRVQLMVQVLLKISQTPVSSNIPRWRLGAIKLVNGEWWCRQYQVNLARPLHSGKPTGTRQTFS